MKTNFTDFLNEGIEPIDETALRNRIQSMSGFLHKDRIGKYDRNTSKWIDEGEGLGLNKIITKLHAEYGVSTGLTSDEIDNFNYGLQQLLKTDYPKDKIKSKLKYFLPDGIENARLVKNDDGSYSYISKLNTNYTALTDLLINLIKAMLTKGDETDRNLAQMSYDIIMKNKYINKEDIKKGLFILKPELKRLIVKYIGTKKGDYEIYTEKINMKSDIGVKAEDLVAKVIKDHKAHIAFQGGDGNFIDMIFGCDLIVENRDRYKTLQIKSYYNTSEDAEEQYLNWLDNMFKNYDYKDIDWLGVVFNGKVYVYDLKKGMTPIITPAQK